MEKIDVIAHIFGSLDDFFIFISNETKIPTDNHFDELHTFIKLVYEHSTHPFDSAIDKGDGRKDWNKVIELLKNDLIIESIDLSFNNYYKKLNKNQLKFLTNEYISDKSIRLIQQYLKELYL